MQRSKYPSVLLCVLFGAVWAVLQQASAQGPSDLDESSGSLPESVNPSYEAKTPEELQRLVAPIALYPDSLAASILTASTFPDQVSEAWDWLAPRQNLPPDQIASEADQQDWDPSVKALLAFPPVLQNLATNLSWTSELGDAYTNQPDDVMNAIQALRRQAKKAGTLKSNDQIHVVDKDGYISIEPANPDSGVVYLPAYNPWIAYGYPIDPWPGWIGTPGVWWDGPGLYFGLSFGVAPFIVYDWGWNRWRFDWHHRGVFWDGRPYWVRGPAFFDRDHYYRGFPRFAHPRVIEPRIERGFEAPRNPPQLRSGPFTGIEHGGNVRNFSARGNGSFNGFHGGGFPSGGFRGGGFHGGPPAARFHGGPAGGFHGGGGIHGGPGHR